MKEKTLEDFLAEHDSYSYSEIEDLYEEMLDDIYGDVEICGMTYNSGRALKELDPTAYRCGCSDYSSEEFEETDNAYYRKDDYAQAENDLQDHLDELEALAEEEN